AGCPKSKSHLRSERDIYEFILGVDDECAIRGPELPVRDVELIVVRGIADKPRGNRSDIGRDGRQRAHIEMPRRHGAIDNDVAGYADPRLTVESPDDERHNRIAACNARLRHDELVS